jgi:hypothetical protein
VFTDELEWTQISRSIQETGEAARRGEPIDSKTLYAWLIAPFWAIDSTESAYAAIKYANVVVMCLAAVPTYFLARMLVPRGAALVVAVLAVCIPAMAYVTSIVPEALAYPWFALGSWLAVRALASRRRLDIALAVLVSIAAVYVRSKLIVIPAAFALAAFWLWLTGPRGRALRAGWTRGDTLGAALLALGAFFLFNRVVLQHVETWQVTSQYWKDRMFDLGLDAGFALTVGLGVLPVVGGLASLRLPGRGNDPVYRAFAAYLAASIVGLGLYTATKAAYLSTTFATLTEERNLFYLAPLLLVGTALVLLSPKLDWIAVGLATAFAGFLILTQVINLQNAYFEAPGFSILVLANRHFGWGVEELRLALLVVLALSVLVLALRARRAVLVAATALGLLWLQTGQIAMSSGINDLANKLRTTLPQHPDWIDRAADGEPVTYVGQAIRDPNTIWLNEFWNRSLRHVQSFDNTAPGPGPTMTPKLIEADGTLAGTYDTRYVLADSGIELAAEKVDGWGGLTLYRTELPWKLRDSVERIYSDGWASNFAAYNYFEPGRRGHLEVTLARTGVTGGPPPAWARVRAGEIAVNHENLPELGERQIYERQVRVLNGSSTTLRIPVDRTPVRVEVELTPTFQPSASDRRQLGAQVQFRFVPDDRG